MRGPERSVIIELYRHGRAKKNTDNSLVAGRQPHSPLIDVGLSQAEGLAACFEQRNQQDGTKFKAAFSSPAERAMVTGLVALGGVQPDLPVTLDPGFHELSKGAWEGLPRSALLVNGAQVERYMPRSARGWYSAVLGGESYADVAERKIASLEEIGRDYEPGDRIAVFGHAIATRCVAAALHQRDLSFFEIPFPHCSRATFTYNAIDGLQLQMYPASNGGATFAQPVISES